MTVDALRQRLVSGNVFRQNGHVQRIAGLAIIDILIDHSQEFCAEIDFNRIVSLFTCNQTQARIIYEARAL